MKCTCRLTSAGQNVQMRHESRRAGRPRQLSCHVGHPMSGPNLITSGGTRQCRTCKNARKRKGEPYTDLLLRRNAPGQVLARGPLDYDVPVMRRCVCGHVYETTLATLHEACPSCRRYPEAA